MDNPSSFSIDLHGKKEGRSLVSLYFHFPFCLTKCPYCHFAVFPNKPKWKMRFLHALFLEWKSLLPHLKGYVIISLYFGGGTPTLFPKGIEAALHFAHKHLSLSPRCEITVEANPERLTPSLIDTLKQAGVNRLSIGIQSFDDHLLAILGRRHSAKEGIDAVHTAYNSGITNVSIDLMYELPYQTKKSFKHTLMTISTLPITHLSLYNLTFEPHTVFNKRYPTLKPHLPSEESCVTYLQLGCETFEDMGLKRYEISAFAREGYHSIHNSGYWKGRPFFGLGPSAFSYAHGKRWRNMTALPRYIQALEKGESPIDFEEKLPYPANICELLAVRLRLLEGVDLSSFEKTFAPLPPCAHVTLATLEKKGYLVRCASLLQLTEKGQLFYDSVAAEIITI